MIIVIYYQQDLQLFEKPPDHENAVFFFLFQWNDAEEVYRSVTSEPATSKISRVHWCDGFSFHNLKMTMSNLITLSHKKKKKNPK